jgi:homoserine dehydrogenase
MINTFNLGLIGFGNVGQELAHILIERANDWAKNYACVFKVTAISARSKGSLISRKGVDLKRALADIAETGVFKRNNPEFAPLNPLELTRLNCVDVVIEISTLNISSGQPASDHLICALQNGKDVITANKGPIAFNYHELKLLASEANRSLLFEGTVMDGTPVFNLIRDNLPGCRIASFKGILNSTTNYILTEMASGIKYAAALEEAKKLGFVETDSSLDLDGWDAAAKVAALMNVIFDARITPHEIERTGIANIKAADLRNAEREGKTIRLVCEGYKDENSCRGQVAPVAIPLDDPLAMIKGTSSALTLVTDLAGVLTIESHNPQIRQTAYALISDLLTVVKRRS